MTYNENSRLIMNIQAACFKCPNISDAYSINII